MQLIVQIASIALVSGLVYALVSLGFTLVFGIMRVVNFAHGEFYMAGAYALFLFYGVLQLPYAAAVLASAIAVGCIGVVAERLLFRPFMGNEMSGMIMSLALATTMQAAVSLLFTVDERSVARPVSGAFEFAGAYFAKDQLLVVAVTLVVLGALYYLIENTRLGLTIRAVAQDSVVARLQGVTPWRITALTFGLSCALAGIAGALMAPIYTINPYMGETIIVKAFIIVVLGGLGSLPGVIVAAFILSFTEAIASTFYNATVATMISFLIVMLVLLIKPSGLLGRSS